MTTEIMLLSTTAATIAFVHTLLGPDHYLPFVAMAKARNWSIAKVVRITLLCGVGHIVGSIALGFIGVFAGIQLGSLEWIEGVRGSLAAWALVAFGLVYLVWGLRAAYKNKPHSHSHSHDGVRHSHLHTHYDQHAHVHASQKADGAVGPWAIFILFVLGPCEPLIPILMYPAAKESLASVIVVTAVFGLVTVVTMLMAVLISVWGLQGIKVPKLQRFSHAFVGATLLMCGCSIAVFGL